jgi:hypothetical protein
MSSCELLVDTDGSEAHTASIFSSRGSETLSIRRYYAEDKHRHFNNHEMTRTQILIASVQYLKFKTNEVFTVAKITTGIYLFNCACSSEAVVVWHASHVSKMQCDANAEGAGWLMLVRSSINPFVPHGASWYVHNNFDQCLALQQLSNF